MRIKKFIPIFAAIFMLIFIIGYIFIPTRLVNFATSDVTEIHIRDGNGGNEIDIDDASEIEYIVSGLDNLYSKTGDIQFGVGSSLYIDFILDDGTTRSLLLQGPDSVVKRRIYYKPAGSDISEVYYHVNELVKVYGKQDEI